MYTSNEIFLLTISPTIFTDAYIGNQQKKFVFFPKYFMFLQDILSIILENGIWSLTGDLSCLYLFLQVI